ncbi:MAG: NAD(P)H-quinone oxidoreductase subunit F [Pseudanabaenaceae cyanobacterium SKYGB_i_bin29]|nr:NAD(P)H-quinone oxidoreductase subunit F [Pseudanabaenaceae cyanobacterium SKYG29]MDW8421225.1 NAD(P)H-quinone oxidoreductase subunit F [Pseudanabaenaceae cyanobacterium SKYGB_i_bin29]
MVDILRDWVWLIPLYGLLGAVATLPWSLGFVQRTGQRPAAYLNLVATFLALAHSLVIFLGQAPPNPIEYRWLEIGDFSLTLTLDISPTTTGAAFLIGLISFLSQLYGLASLEMDWSLARFYALMGFFESAMTGIAMSDSFFLSYGLLEMLTLSTYLLVGFWYAQPLVVTAARDAFWTKRVGDLVLLMGLIGLSTLTDSLHFSDLAAWAASPDTVLWAESHPLWANLLGIALIAGPVGKCAQFPLHLWLDEAMEGPNPASVLRNSVVVACGAYVLIKLTPVLAISPIALDALLVLGTITAVGAALVSIAQIDIKRALSHLTSAHLGLVFIAVGTEHTEVALAFLLTHAVAKALLFTSTGGIMMTTMTQDLTEMGGIGLRMPATAMGFAVGSLSAVGLLPLGTFWTLLNYVDSLWLSAPVLVAVGLAVNGITAFGLMRVFSLVFLGKPQPKTRRVPEVLWLAAVPTVSLTIVNLLAPILVWQWGLYPPQLHNPWLEIALLVTSGTIGLLWSGKIYVWHIYAPGATVTLPPPPVSLVWKSIQNLLANDLYVQAIYRSTAVFVVGQGSRLVGWLDRFVVDGLVNFLGIASVFTGETLKYTVTGRSQQYALTILVGLLLAMGLLLWKTSP